MQNHKKNNEQADKIKLRTRMEEYGVGKIVYKRSPEGQVKNDKIAKFNYRTWVAAGIVAATFLFSGILAPSIAIPMNDSKLKATSAYEQQVTEKDEVIAGKENENSALRNENGQLINENGQLIDENGKLIEDNESLKDKVEALTPKRIAIEDLQKYVGNKDFQAAFSGSSNGTVTFNEIFVAKYLEKENLAELLAKGTNRNGQSIVSKITLPVNDFTETEIVKNIGNVTDGKVYIMVDSLTQDENKKNKMLTFNNMVSNDGTITNKIVRAGDTYLNITATYTKSGGRVTATSVKSEVLLIDFPTSTFSLASEGTNNGPTYATKKLPHISGEGKLDANSVAINNLISSCSNEASLEM